MAVAADTRLAPSFWSRYASRKFVIPDAATDPVGFYIGLKKALVSLSCGPNNLPALLPMEDASLRVCLANEKELALVCRMILPPPGSFLIASDKKLTHDAAKKMGIPTPETLAPATPEALASELSLRRGEFVLKPTQGSGSSGIRYNERLSEAQARAHWTRYGPILLQERIPREGQALGASLLFDSQGSFIAGFSHRRLREFPASGGPSSDREGILDESLISDSRKLLESLKWRGVAMVEWKVHPVTGQRLLLEINPRFWGSLELAVRSGANFPLWYALLALRRPLPRSLAWRPGVRCRSMIPGEILRYCQTPRREREPLRKFFSGLPRSAEEWDAEDLRGSLLLPILMLLLAIRPKYWRFLRRR